MMDTLAFETYPLDTQMLNDLRALQSGGQPNLIGELLDLLQSVAPPLLEKIRLAAAQGDSETLFRSAHSLKGSCASVGAVALAARLKEVEQMGRENHLAGVTEKIAQVESEYARAILALKNERGKG
jgi:HPt (histidine-containing phosphotransfer) domain-containing protein